MFNSRPPMRVFKIRFVFKSNDSQIIKFELEYLENMVLRKPELIINTVIIRRFGISGVLVASV